MAIFAIVGAQLSTFGYEVPFILCAGMQVLGLTLCLFLQEPPIESGPPRGDLRSACKAILLSGDDVRWMALAPGFVIGINQSFLWMYPTMLPWWLGVESFGRSGMFTISIVTLVTGATIFWITCPRKVEVKG